MSHIDDEELVEILLDLQHDLGKYLRLPLVWLPADAGPEAIRRAATEAIRATRRTASGTRSAVELWAAFEAEVDGALDDRPERAALDEAVERALAWDARLDEPIIDRAALLADFNAVDRAIRTLRAAVEVDR